MKGLMSAPYKRIMVMHLMLIFGGWIILLLKTPMAALAFPGATQDGAGLQCASEGTRARPL
jgi:hypothetical protein